MLGLVVQTQAPGTTVMVQSLSGVIVGLVIGLAGVLLGLPRLRRERGFDLRLRWCEGALGAFHQAGAAILAAKHEDGGDAAEECWAEVIRCYEALIPIYGQAWLYATSEGSAAISTFMKSLEGLIDDHLAAHDAGELGPACTRCLDDLKQAGLELSKVARRHLGFSSVDELEGESFNAERIFARSFKGRVLRDHHAPSS